MEKYSLRYQKPNVLLSILVIFSTVIFIVNQSIPYIENKIFQSALTVSLSVFSTATLFSFIDRWLWKYIPFKWMYSVPDFSGFYIGDLDSFKGKPHDNLTHYKRIIQNGSDIVIRSYTLTSKGIINSSSVSIHATIVNEVDGTFSIINNFINHGNYVQPSSPHYGTEILTIYGKKNNRSLIGRYYTERLPDQTKGMITMKITNDIPVFKWREPPTENPNS